MEEETRAIAAELRCPVCQNLSVADSPSELAQQMRALIEEQVKAGKSPEEVKKFFVSKYGEWVLLAPPAKGFNLFLWILPGAGALLGLVLVLIVMRRWIKKKETSAPIDVGGENPAFGRRDKLPAPAENRPDNRSRREFLHGDRERIGTELREIEFDFQAGKLSEADYTALRRELEGQSASLLSQLESLPPEPTQRGDRTRGEEKKIPATQARPPKNWQLAAGGLFLVLLGLTLGVLLTQSLRPRVSERETITGDFLTGTRPAGDASASLAQGRAAFDRRDWAQAIEAFKKVLAADPNQPEAHSYMGLILAQAGHIEGALMAFDRALAADPNFPLALWGKGMLLYQTKSDPAGAREALNKVAVMMPPGPEKAEVEKTIAELDKAGSSKQPQTPPLQAAAGEIQGVVDIDPKLKGKVDASGVLFIIAKSTSGAGGPPLAVKKIADPKFPVVYSIGARDVMMPGAVFSGRLFLSARLDKDGNVATKEPGDLAGEYKKNPVEIGAKKINIVLEPIP